MTFQDGLYLPDHIARRRFGEHALKYDSATGRLLFGTGGHLSEWCAQNGKCTNCASIIGAVVTFSGITWGTCCVQGGGDDYISTRSEINKSFSVGGFSTSGSLCISAVNIGSAGYFYSFVDSGCAGTATDIGLDLTVFHNGGTWQAELGDQFGEGIAFVGTTSGLLCATPLTFTNQILSCGSLAHRALAYGGTATVNFLYAP